MRIERLRATYHIDIVWTQFPLHPDTPAEGQTVEQLFAGRNFDLAAAKAQMQRLMEAEGLPFGDRDMVYNSRLAQELAKWAETQEGGDAIHDALFRAYFVDGINLADVDRLGAIAETVGLDGAAARMAVATRAFAEAVNRDWQRCMDVGVRGVPTYAANRVAVVGCQPYEVLDEFARRAGALPRPN